MKRGENMKKKDLIPGYMVEFRNGEKAIYTNAQQGGVFIIEDSVACIPLTSYDNNLRCSVDSKMDTYDVIKVYGFTNKYNEALQFKEKNRRLLWHRGIFPKLTPYENEVLKRACEQGFLYIRRLNPNSILVYETLITAKWASGENTFDKIPVGILANKDDFKFIERLDGMLKIKDILEEYGVENESNN